MTPQETAVLEALQTFKRQADDCATCLYAYLTVHAVAGRSRPIRDHINSNALFWNTALHALQAALVLALGRVFETNTPHNVGTFMRAMAINRTAFSRTSLAARKAPIFGNDLAGHRSYVTAARIPRLPDFRRVANFVKQHRGAYLTGYRDLRDHVFAHTLTADRAQISALFSKTNIRQLQRMTTYLVHLHDAFWEAFHNGGRLTLRPRRYSVARMLSRPKGRAIIVPIQETVVAQTKQALQPWTPAPVYRLRRRARP
jgi:hypothetical protein